MDEQQGFIQGYEYKEPEPYKPHGRERFKKPIDLYGPGPAGKTCKTCEHHISHKMGRLTTSAKHGD